MFFVVAKPQFQRVISIVRDDRDEASMGPSEPFLRLEAKNDYLKLDGMQAGATIPATVYETGVLFLKVTLFRRLIGSIRGEPFLSIQVTGDEVLIDRVRLPLDANEMLLYPNPEQAPTHHPSVAFMTTPSPRRPTMRQLTLWNLDKR
jgi:hypothetical protein